MTLTATPSPAREPVVIIAYPTLDKVIRYDARSGALMNTVAEVEGAAWVESNVLVLEDFADPQAQDVVRWFTQEGVEKGEWPISSGIAPNDIFLSSTGSGWLLLFDDRLVNFLAGTSISASAGSRLDSLLHYRHCYVDCDPGGGINVLDLLDFICWVNSFIRGEPYACDCDTSTGSGVCDIIDFLCFQNAFTMGCP